MKVVHCLSVRGHSYLPCDIDFGIIEKLQRKREIVDLHSGWKDMTRDMFDVTSMRGKDMFKFKNHFSIFFKKSATKKGDKFLVTKCKVLSFYAEQYDIDIS